MRTKLLFGLLLVSALAATPALAQRQPVPIVDYPNVPVATASGKALTAERVKQAIQEAAKAHGWTLAYEPSGAMLATLVVRNKHTVMVEIGYTASSYSIKYRDSVNMKYAVTTVVDTRINNNFSRINPSTTAPMIHPFYNKWVQDLKDGIRIELLKV